MGISLISLRFIFLWRGFLTLWETIIIPSKNHEISHIVCKKYLCNLLFFTLWQHYRVCVGRCSLWRPYSNSLLRNHPIFFIDSVMISWGEFLVFFFLWRNLSFVKRLDSKAWDHFFLSLGGDESVLFERPS